MKATASTDLGRATVQFFREFLPAQRGLCAHTVRSYRDTFVLLFGFLAKDAGRSIEALALEDLTAERVIRFLAHLEKKRGNSIATRNIRLAAIHTFARFLAGFFPERMTQVQMIRAIPFKKGTQRRPVDYLDAHEMEKLLGNIDQNSADGRRDHTLFSLMLNTGARVQEILNLRVSDIRLEAPHLVRLVGKGNKVRLCPIWPRTAKRLVALIATLPTDDGDAGQRHLFRNRAGAPLTRFGVRYLLRKHLPTRTSAAAAGSGRQVHPHLLRHTTAVCLLKSGVDFAMISQWLGHSSLKVTMRYAKADLDLKRQVLAQVFPHALGAPPAGRLRIDGSELTGWLRNL